MAAVKRRDWEGHEKRKLRTYIDDVACSGKGSNSKATGLCGYYQVELRKKASKKKADKILVDAFREWLENGTAEQKLNATDALRTMKYVVDNGLRGCETVKPVLDVLEANGLLEKIGEGREKRDAFGKMLDRGGEAGVCAGSQ